MVKKTKLKNFVLDTVDLDKRPAAWKKKTVLFLQRLLTHIEAKNNIRHKIAVICLDRMTLSHSDGEIKNFLKKKRLNKEAVFGGFQSPRGKKMTESKTGIHRKERCTIILPLRQVKMPKSIHSGFAHLISIVLHEVGHYTQFRDKKKLTEDDIEQRTARLAKNMFPKEALIGFNHTSWYKYV